MMRDTIIALNHLIDTVRFGGLRRLIEAKTEVRE